MTSPLPRSMRPARYVPREPIGLGVPSSRRSRWSALVALVLHLLLLAGLIRVAPGRNLEYEVSAGDPASGKAGGGGGGGGRIQIVALPALAAAAVPTPRAVVTPPVPVPTPAVKPPIEVPPPPPPPPPSSPVLAVQPDTVLPAGAASGAGAGAGTGAGSGTGTGTGSGTGSGNGSGSGAGSGPGNGSGGEGGRARPPEPRQLILPPAEVPSVMRGVTISVTFMVGPEGRVEKIRFQPEPADRGFAKKLEEVMKSYRFRPARGPDGSPVAGTTTVQVTF